MSPKPPRSPKVQPIKPLTDAEAVAKVIELCEALQKRGLIIQTLPTRDTLPTWVENLIGQLVRVQQEVKHLDALLKLRSDS